MSLNNMFNRIRFRNSGAYWERRYSKGRTSGAGSYGALAQYKAEVINQLVKSEGINSVIEFGCGDGNQLLLSHYPQYLGVDVSTTAIELCRKKFRHDPDKDFVKLADYSGEKADLALSVDVVFHLVEDAVFEHHMSQVFKAANRFVVIYSSNTDRQAADSAVHVRNRRFTDWIDNNRQDWTLFRYLPNPYLQIDEYRGLTESEFYIYRKCDSDAR